MSMPDNDGVEFSALAIVKAKREMMRMQAEPDDLFYFANEAEIGNWELMCCLRSMRVTVLKVKPIPLWTIKPRRRRR